MLEKGSRRDAGFSIIRSNRVITGWPDSYRPETIFGEQEGGSNNLVNQRLFGELILEGFEVSHTKDQILFDDGEQEELELNLKKQLGGMRQLALSYRKGADDIQVLMSVGKLTPLGDPAPNAPKWFAAVEIIRLRALTETGCTRPPKRFPNTGKVSASGTPIRLATLREQVYRRV